MVSCGGQVASQRGQVQAAPAFVDLHRIAAAHGEAGLCFSFEVRKLALPASAAGLSPWDAQRLESRGPHVKCDEAYVPRFGLAEQNFDRKGSFKRRNDSSGCAQHADRVTRRLIYSRRAILCRVAVLEEGLPLQVRGLYKVAVNDPEAADTSSDHQARKSRTQSAAADNRR